MKHGLTGIEAFWKPTNKRMSLKWLLMKLINIFRASFIEVPFVAFDVFVLCIFQPKSSAPSAAPDPGTTPTCTWHPWR